MTIWRPSSVSWLEPYFGARRGAMDAELRFLMEVRGGLVRHRIGARRKPRVGRV